MLPNNKFSSNTPETPWLKWVIIVAVIGGAYNAFRPHGTDDPNPIRDAFNKASHNIDTKKSDIEDFKNKLFPGTTSVRAKDIEPGSGAPASCGQKVKIAYTGSVSDGATIKDTPTKDKPLSFTIGNGEVMPVLEQGVIGMRKGGKRALMAPPGLAYGLKKFARDDIPQNVSAMLELTLLDATPALPDPTGTPFRILGDKAGFGRGFQCGAEVKMNVTVWGIDGHKIFSTRDGSGPVSFTIGKSQVFIGLEQGVIGMNNAGGRSLILPPVFQKTMNGNAPIMDFHFPKNETVLVDIEPAQ